jgi:type VII secretion protein EccB
MPSRQDQLHSYQFTVQRVVAALVTRETDPARSPFRRIAGATLVGVLVAALGLGGAAAYGVLSPGGSTKWRDENAVIVEKDSGAVYVYRDNRLHPVLNYTSALLILNSTNPKQVSISRRSLTDVPRGPTWGIAGAPATLPLSDNLLRGGWTVCTDQTRSVLFVGSGPAGTDLGGKALLVSAPDDTRYMLVKGRKHRIPDAGALLPYLVWTKQPLPVAPAFLNAVPAGADLAVPAIPGRGEPAARPPGAKIGQVYTVKETGDLFVALADGLASITKFQARLIQAAPGTDAVINLTRDEFAGYTQGLTVPAFAPGDLPADEPALTDPPTRAVCSGTAITVDAPLPDLSGATSPRPAASGTVLADRVVVPPGRGAVVTSGSGLFLITDLGIRYSVPSADLLPVLGYSKVQPVSVPAEVVALLPAGPALDPAAAKGQP